MIAASVAPQEGLSDEKPLPPAMQHCDGGYSRFALPAAR